jgi:tetratricopeptide (TPR) repeat protein
VARLREALALSEQCGDDDLIVDSRLSLWRFLSADEAEAWSDALLKQLKERHDLLRLNELLFGMMWLYLANGNFARAVACCDDGIRLAGELGVPPVQYPTLKAIALLRLGRYSEAWESLQREVADAEHQFGRLNRDLGVALYHFEVLAYERAAALLRDVDLQAQRLNRDWVRHWAQVHLTLSLIRSGEIGEALRTPTIQDPDSLGTLSASEPALLPEAVLTELLLAQGRLEEALVHAESSATQAAEGGLRPEYLSAVEVRLRILLRLGRPQEALDLTGTALRLTEDMATAPLTWRILAARAEALATLGDSDRAVQTYTSASEVILTLVETVGDETLKEGFLANTQVAAILAATRREQC